LTMERSRTFVFSHPPHSCTTRIICFPRPHLFLPGDNLPVFPLSSFFFPRIPPPRLLFVLFFEARHPLLEEMKKATVFPLHRPVSFCRHGLRLGTFFTSTRRFPGLFPFFPPPGQLCIMLTPLFVEIFFFNVDQKPWGSSEGEVSSSSPPKLNLFVLSPLHIKKTPVPPSYPRA